MIITNTIELKAAIQKLQGDAVVHKALLIDQYNTTYYNLQSINFIKKQLQKLINTAAIEKDVVDKSLAVGAGLLSKQLFVRGSKNIFKSFMGNILQFVVGAIVANNTDKIKNKASEYIDKIFPQK